MTYCTIEDPLLISFCILEICSVAALCLTVVYTCRLKLEYRNKISQLNDSNVTFAKSDASLSSKLKTNKSNEHDSLNDTSMRPELSSTSMPSGGVSSTVHEYDVLNHSDNKLYKHVINKHLMTMRNSNQYEEINEHLHWEMKKGGMYADDATYAKFISKEKALASLAQEKNKGRVEKNRLGTTDHLRYLKESKNQSKLNENYDAYLIPNRFSARSNCPEELMNLCNNQDSAYSTLDREDNSGCKKNVPCCFSEKMEMVQQVLSKTKKQKLASSREHLV